MSTDRETTCGEDLIDSCCCCCPSSVKIFLAWCFGGCEDPNTPTPYRNPDRHITCYVRRSVARDLMSADTRFLDQVKAEMRKMENTRLDIKDWEDPSRNMTAPSIVICAAASRVGSDVDHALRGIEYDKNTVILIFHPLASHVRAPGRTEDTLLDDKYRALGAMVDVLYTGHEGPYKCPTNNEAIHRLSSFLRKRGAGPSETSSLTY